MSKGMYVPKESQPKQGGTAAKARDGEKGGKRKIVAQNKKARHDYAIVDTYGKHRPHRYRGQVAA